MEELILELSQDDVIAETMKKFNFNARRIILNHDISDSIIESVVLPIIAWNFEDKDIPAGKRKPIYIYVNTNGGDSISGFMLLEAIRTSVTPVITIGLGMCASMGSYILAAGHQRLIFPATVVLYHDGQSGYYTSGNKGKDIQKFYDEHDERLVDFMVEHTNMTKEFLESIKDREYFIFAEDIISKGIADKIITSLDEIV